MERVRFFDDLAERWDAVCDVQRVAASIRAGLLVMGINPGEHVVDVGCGTGTLLRCLLDVLGPGGRVHAVDISPRMIDKARAKIDDPRVSFAVTSAARLPVLDSSVDRIFCFSCWPHIDQPEPVLAEWARALRPGGVVSIWHADGRDIINGIHRNAGAAVADDILAPAEALAALLGCHGFDVYEVIDTPTEYRVSAIRGAGRAS